MQRSPKHDIVNAAAELVEHVIDQPVAPIVAVIDGLVRSIKPELLEYDSVVGRALELRSIVERQRQPAAFEHTEPRQGQGQVVIDRAGNTSNGR